MGLTHAHPNYFRQSCVYTCVTIILSLCNIISVYNGPGVQVPVFVLKSPPFSSPPTDLKMGGSMGDINIICLPTNYVNVVLRLM